MPDTFACSFTATELEARSGISFVVERLRDFNLPEERVGDVQIALAEAVNNVVEHAYKGVPTGDVRIRCNLSPEQLWIRISDVGPPFPGGELPAGDPADLSGPLEDLPEGGFGWFLIRELTSLVQYERTDGANQLSLCFQIQSSTD